MKKIMFNDQYGLTEAVLDGRKTQTRRIAYEKPFKHIRSCGFIMEGKDKGKLAINDGNEIVAKSTYKMGEVVAVAQRYSDITFANDIFKGAGLSIGWENKMFVKSSLMPHQIKITNIRCEILQDISTDDCMKEGIFCSHIEGVHDAYTYDATFDRFVKKWWYRTPIEAYKILSSRLHLHWDSNPLVFVYDFKLVK